MKKKPKILRSIVLPPFKLQMAEPQAAEPLMAEPQAARAEKPFNIPPGDISGRIGRHFPHHSPIQKIYFLTPLTQKMFFLPGAYNVDFAVPAVPNPPSGELSHCGASPQPRSTGLSHCEAVQQTVVEDSGSSEVQEESFSFSLVSCAEGVARLIDDLPPGLNQIGLDLETLRAWRR
jgi:hypothetical protein